LCDFAAAIAVAMWRSSARRVGAAWSDAGQDSHATAGYP